LCAVSPSAAPCTAWDLVYPVAFIRIRAELILFHKIGFSPIINLSEESSPLDTKFWEAKKNIPVPCVFVVKYKESVMRRMFGFMIGIVVGALIGSTVALLLAPENRRKIQK